MPIFDDLINVVPPEATVGTQKLIWDEPNTVGKKNALRRARRLLSLQWSPLRKIAQNTINGVLCIPDRPPLDNEIRLGAPYSSVRIAMRYIGRENAPINGFQYAVNNPFSDFYLRYLQDFNEPYYNTYARYALLFYGTVCSAFCDYAFNFPYTYFTCEWDRVPELYPLEEQDVQSLELLDTIVTVRESGEVGGHVRIITGIGRDESGKVCEVEVSEGTNPQARTIHHTASQFTALLIPGGGNYRIYRCNTVDQTEDPEEEPLPACPDVLMSMIPGSLIGNNDAVCFAMDRPDGTLVVKCKDHTFTAEVADLPTEEFGGKTYYLWKHEPLPTGEYKVWIRKDGKDGKAGEFAVLNLPRLLPKKDGKSLPLHRWRFCTKEGEAITPRSECLYANGALKATIDLAVTDGDVISNQRVTLQKDGAGIKMRTMTAFLDANGNPQRVIRLDDDTAVYTYVSTVGEKFDLIFTAPEFCDKAVYSQSGTRQDLQSHVAVSEHEFAARSVSVTTAKQKNHIGHASLHLYRGRHFFPMDDIPLYSKAPEEEITTP